MAGQAVYTSLSHAQPEKDNMTSENQAPRGYSFAPLVASQQGQANQHTPLALDYPLLDHSRHVRACYCVPQSSPDLLCSDRFCYETFRALFRLLAPFPLTMSWAAVVRGSALIPKTLRSSGEHPIHAFSWPPLPTQPAPPTSSPNMTHFGSLVSSMRGTNPANKIRLLRKVASILSLPVLRSVSR